jgi:hypothetical protein
VKRNSKAMKFLKEMIELKESTVVKELEIKDFKSS